MTGKLSYRPMEEGDLKKICTFPQQQEELFFMFPKAVFPLTPDQLKTAAENRHDSTVILRDGEIVGFANFYEIEKERYCSIGNVIVNPQLRGRGIGRFLIETMEYIGWKKYNVSEFHISCFNTNTKGILLYSKLGYKPYEIEKRFNPKNEPVALIKLRKVIESTSFIE